MSSSYTDHPDAFVDLGQGPDILGEGEFCPTSHEEPGVVGEPCLSCGDDRDPWHDRVERALAAEHIQTGRRD